MFKSSFNAMDDPKTPPAVRLRAALAIPQRPHFPQPGWHLPERIESPREQQVVDGLAEIKAEYDAMQTHSPSVSAGSLGSQPIASSAPSHSTITQASARGPQRPSLAARPVPILIHRYSSDLGTFNNPRVGARMVGENSRQHNTAKSGIITRLYPRAHICYPSPDTAEQGALSHFTVALRRSSRPWPRRHFPSPRHGAGCQ
jgi:hypothetical protein